MNPFLFYMIEFTALESILCVYCNISSITNSLHIFSLSKKCTKNFVHFCRCDGLFLKLPKQFCVCDLSKAVLCHIFSVIEFFKRRFTI